MGRQRRTRGEGSTWKKAGVWYAQATVAGKRVRVQAPTLEEARAKLRAAQVARAGSGTAVDGITVAEYLTGQWLPTTRAKLKASSYQRAEELIRLHVIPRLGGLALGRLAASNLEALYAELLAAGKAPRTVGHVHRVLSRALKIAVRQGVLAHNVAGDVDPPRVARKDDDFLTPEQVKALERAARGEWAVEGKTPKAERLAALFIVAVRSGARLGELCALQWADVDLKGASMVIRRSLSEVNGTLEIVETKTGRARRVDLDAASVRALKEHKARMIEEMAALRLRAEEAEKVEAQELLAIARRLANGFVFLDTEGNWLRRSNVRRRHWLPLLGRAGLPEVRIHDLRHTHASIALSRGASVVDVASRLGHADTSTTLRRYAHTLPGGGRAVADKVSDALE